MKRSILSYFSTIVTFLALTAIAEGADYKRLSTQWKGPNMVLDVINGGNRNNFVQLSKKADVSGQAWKITKADDWLNLTTEFRGRNMCLDIVNGGSRDGMAQLAKCEDVSGQLWTLSDESAAEAAPPAPSHPGGAIPTAHILQAMTFPGDGDVPPQSVFSRDTPKILLALEVRNVKPEDKLVTTWIAEKTEAAPANFEISAVAVPLGSSTLVSSSFSKPNAGWPPGQYRVDITHNGGPVEYSHRFSVKD